MVLAGGLITDAPAGAGPVIPICGDQGSTGTLASPGLEAVAWDFAGFWRRDGMGPW
jgi:hypothetical protein